MVYFKVILFLSLTFSHIESYAKEAESTCLTLISNNQCIEALEVCRADAEQGDPKAQTALGLMLSGITHGDFRKNYKQSSIGSSKQQNKDTVRLNWRLLRCI